MNTSVVFNSLFNKLKHLEDSSEYLTVTQTSDESFSINFNDCSIISCLVGDKILCESPFNLEEDYTFGNSMVYDLDCINDVVNDCVNVCKYTLSKYKKMLNYNKWLSYEEITSLPNKKVLQLPNDLLLEISLDSRGFHLTVVYKDELHLDAETLKSLNVYCTEMNINLSICNELLEDDTISEIKMFS